MGIIIAVILLAAWIYLVYVTLKKKTNLFHDQMEPELAERRLRRLKKFLLVAGISVAAFIPVTVYAAIVDPSEGGAAFAVVFSILGFCAVLFLIGTIGGWVIFLKGRRETRYKEYRLKVVPFPLVTAVNPSGIGLRRLRIP